MKYMGMKWTPVRCPWKQNEFPSPSMADNDLSIFFRNLNEAVLAITNNG
jgi:hypothetical protein